MKIPSKAALQKIMKGHTKKDCRIHRNASSLLFLRYLAFLKKLAKEADNIAYRHRLVVITQDDVSLAEEKVGNISEGEKIRRRRRKQKSSPVWKKSTPKRS